MPGQLTGRVSDALRHTQAEVDARGELGATVLVPRTFGA